MSEKFPAIRHHPHNRSLTLQERFSFFVFLGKLFVSKFGIFFVFLVIHIGSRYSSAAYSLHLSKCQSSDQLGVLKKTHISSTKDMKLIPTPNLMDCHTDEARNKIELNNQIFHKIRKYCIIGTIVILFLNPQQTKYFGGLAVVLKQAGFFTKYSKSEKMVYIFSWVFVILFFSSSIQVASLTRKMVV